MQVKVKEARWIFLASCISISDYLCLCIVDIYIHLHCIWNLIFWFWPSELYWSCLGAPWNQWWTYMTLSIFFIAKNYFRVQLLSDYSCLKPNQLSELERTKIKWPWKLTETFSSAFQKDSLHIANQTDIERQGAQKTKVLLILPIAPKIAKHTSAFQTF